MRRHHVDLRRYTGHERRNPSRRLPREVRQLQCRQFDCGINPQHRRHHRVVHIGILLSRQVIVDIGLVVDPPPRHFVRRIRRRNIRFNTAIRREPAGVVILHQILRVPGKLREGQIQKAGAAIVSRIHEWRRLRDLKLRTVIAHAQHRLRNRVELRKVPHRGGRSRFPPCGTPCETPCNRM